MPRVSAASPATGAFLMALLSVAADCRAESARPVLLVEQQRCLALAMYWEARGEGLEGIIAVGWTVLNRVRSRHFPDTPCAVVYQGGEQAPCQFSWWCDGRSDRPRERRSWQAALVIAAHLLVRPPKDPTRGALYFHSTSVEPGWKHVRTARIGRHVFYR